MNETDELVYSRFLTEGNEQDLKILLLRHRESLTLFLNGYVHNMDDAEEIMLDSFAIIASGTTKYTAKGNGSFKTWLFSIGKNRAKMFLRKRKIAYVPIEDDIKDSGNTPEVDMLKEENKQQLYRALESLHPNYRHVLYLQYFEGMKPEEISLVMNKSVKQIYNLAERGKESLKEKLERMGFEYERY